MCNYVFKCKSYFNCQTIRVTLYKQLIKHISPIVVSCYNKKLASTYKIKLRFVENTLTTPSRLYLERYKLSDMS